MKAVFQAAVHGRCSYSFVVASGLNNTIKAEMIENKGR
ncbi:hypothetical protein SD78_1205 [Bacillus badius]|nr:hypothetical protein SD78_1205 [Bacillus badius]